MAFLKVESGYSAGCENLFSWSEVLREMFSGHTTDSKQFSKQLKKCFVT